MIHINRPRTSCPKCLSPLSKKARKERMEAIIFFSQMGNTTKEFTFKAYKQDSVKKALEALFHKKCAFCESHYVGSSYTNIEHFRPKGGVEVNDVIQVPGYYWLASSWENLLPSCGVCNTSHKKNHFPVLNEKKRVRNPDIKLRRERPLLLNPCTDLPERHLHFSEEGIISASKIKGTKSRKGEYTIRFLGLDRAELSQDRQRLAKFFLRDISDCWYHTRRALANPNDFEEEEKLRELIQQINRIVADEDQEFLAMLRQFRTTFELQYQRFLSLTNELFKLDEQRRNIPTNADVEREFRECMASLHKLADEASICDKQRKKTIDFLIRIVMDEPVGVLVPVAEG